MTLINFRPAVRENVGLWINLIGPSGSGKTFTAMRLASGIAGDKPFALIDTENRRGLHYADQFDFHHAELEPPFRPSAYADAVKAADAAGYPVIVIDSGSHVWAGEGGVLDWQEEEYQRMGAKESIKFAAWVKPKGAHKRMVNDFLRVKAHIILCLRAEEKLEMVKENGKTVIQAKRSLSSKDGWIPIADKGLPFEATVSFLLHVDRPGVPDPIKLQEQHKAIFPLDTPITEDSGKKLAEWAAGGQPRATEQTVDQKRAAMVKHFGDLKVSEDRILAVVGKDKIGDISEEEIVILRGLATDVKSGDKSLLDAFPMLDDEAQERAAIQEAA